MIGAIADDFTGATDIAVAFRRAGLRVVLVFDLEQAAEVEAADVVIVALKTRTIAPSAAVEQSLAAARWLRAAGAEQFFFKYCSTFDSRDDGNIGPVADALVEELGASRAVVVPASPAHGRTQYLGHLFVGESLLSESPMRNHPLTPMTDSSIPRVLSRQTRRGVGLLDLSTVRSGQHHLAGQLSAAERSGVTYLVADAVEQSDLEQIGAAVSEDVLVTGAAGMASGLGIALARHRDLRTTSSADTEDDDALGSVRAAALAGSCSSRTLEQVDYMRARHPHHFLNAVAQPDPTLLAEDALAWYDTQPETATPLIYSSQPPEQLRRTQEILGTENASQILESATALIAQGLIERGVRRLVIAGGETSGAVVTGLSVGSGDIGAEVATGVPWIYTRTSPPVALALKSGNFGDPNMIDQALHLTEIP